MEVPERNSSTGENPEQEIPFRIIQESAGNDQVVPRRKLTMEMDLSVEGMTRGARNGGRRKGLGQVELFLLNLEDKRAARG